MKIIQSYWSKPYEQSRIGNRMGGWCDKMFHYMSCALSCLKLSEFYPMELITDQKGEEILVDKIGLPYQSVVKVFDTLDYPTELWAIAKIIAYDLQTEAFVHIDNDVYMWKLFPDFITKGTLCVQSLEEIYIHNKLFTAEILDNMEYIPDSIIKQRAKSLDCRSINAGIIGGRDLTFIHEYAKEAIRFVEQNKDSWNKLKGLNYFNLVFEQYLFYCMAHQQKKEISYLLTDLKDTRYRELVRFWDIPNQASYIHTLASYKQHYIIAEQVAQRLWYEYPEYFYRIHKLIEQNAI